MRVAMRTGMRKAKVALARKLAVVLHRMLADNQPFDFCALRRPTEQGGITSSGGLRHQPPGAGPVAGTMDQARPQNAGGAAKRPRATRSAGLLLRPHQVAAARRPRTEARYRRQDQGSNEG